VVGRKFGYGPINLPTARRDGDWSAEPAGREINFAEVG